MSLILFIPNLLSSRFVCGMSVRLRWNKSADFRVDTRSNSLRLPQERQDDQQQK
jgi:hypothetical protein